MIIEKKLPFPRGKTYSDAAGDGTGALVTMADSSPAVNLEGRTFQVPDTIHKTTHLVTLRIVRFDAAIAVARKCLSFSVASKGDWGARVDGLAGTGGELAKPLDDAYYYGVDGTANRAVATTIAQYDLGYVVDEGPCHVEATTGEKGAVGGAVAMDELGLIGTAAAADTNIATFLEINDTAAVTAVLVYVKGGIQTAAP